MPKRKTFDDDVKNDLNPFYDLVKEFEDSIGITHLTQGSESKALAEKISREQPDTEVRVYADGIWDMFHFGHARALQQAKSVFPNCKLIVGICSDEDTHNLKGKTVMTMKERAESVRHCTHVDEVIEDCPWTITPSFIHKHNIHFVAHDAAPYVDPLVSQEATNESSSSSSSSSSGHTTPDGLDINDVYYLVKYNKMFLPTERTDGISTTNLINRIVIDYDSYLTRNFKRGFSRHDLNVSYLKEKRIIVKEKLNEVKKKSQETIEDWRDSVMNHELVLDFMELFGKNGRIAQTYKKQKKEIMKTLNSPTFSGSSSSEE